MVQQGKNTCGGGKSDPIMTGFTGRSFNFFGEVGKTYNLISSKNHQLSAKLKLAQMWNHNGTNMEVKASRTEALVYTAMCLIPKLTKSILDGC